MNISGDIWDCPYYYVVPTTMSYTSDGRQSLINVTFHVGNVGFHQRNFNLLRFLASPPINSLQPRTYRSYEIFTNVKTTFWLCSIRVGGLPDSLFPIEAIFFSIDVLRAIHRRMISNIRDDAQILTSRSIMLKSYALPKRNSTKVLFLTSLRIFVAR